MVLRPWLTGTKEHPLKRAPRRLPWPPPAGRDAVHDGTAGRSDHRREPDGNRHPNVGLILFYTDEGRFRCSATLMTPTVLLTAAHCTDGVVGSVLVTFDSVIALQPPAPFPVAADPENGYTDEEITAAGYLSGTAFTHPDYSGFTDVRNWNDVGVVVLDEPVTGIAPATLAPLNYLDQFAQPRLNQTLFDLVGYGTEVRKPESGPQKPEPMSYPLIRRYTTAPGQKLTPQLLQVNGNPNDIHGGGGSCFGTRAGRRSSTATSWPWPATSTPRTAATSTATSESTSRWCRTGWPPSGLLPLRPRRRRGAARSLGRLAAAARGRASGR